MVHSKISLANALSHNNLNHKTQPKFMPLGADASLKFMSCFC